MLNEFFHFFVTMVKIILIGFMGAGKSTIGAKLSELLGIPFVDTDHEIERLKGKSIDSIFNDEGEASFRLLERQMINILSMIDTEFVLSVGGGLPCFNNLMLTLKQMGTTVYLKCPTDLLAERLMHDTQVRPLINGLNKEEVIQFIDQKLLEREPVYNQADLIISEEWSAEAILRHLLPRKS